MEQDILQQIQEIISEWAKKRQHTYELKKCWEARNPSMPGEILIYFSNSLYSFFCQGKLIPIELIARPFITAALGTNPISYNSKGDLLRLRKHLEDFDKQFYDLVQQKIEQCVDKLESSDLELWL